MSVKKFSTAAEAISVIDSDEYIWTHSMAATPVVLLESLYEHAKTKTNIIFSLNLKRKKMVLKMN